MRMGVMLHERVRVRVTHECTERTTKAVDYRVGKDVSGPTDWTVSIQVLHRVGRRVGRLNGVGRVTGSAGRVKRIGEWIGRYGYGMNKPSGVRVGASMH